MPRRPLRIGLNLPTVEGTWPAVVEVYRGSALGSLSEEDAGDIYGGAEIFAVAGRSYSIRVQSSNGYGAGFVLDWNRDQPSPPNDYYSAAQLLAGASGAVSTTTYNATWEWYFGDASLLSVDAFYMDLTSYVTFGTHQATYVNATLSGQQHHQVYVCQAFHCGGKEQ